MVYTKKPRVKTAYDFLKQDQACLAYLQKHCDLLKRLQIVVLRYLVSDLHPYCQVLNYYGGVLKLQTLSSAWASRLRFELPHLKRFLVRETLFSDLEKIDILVRPDSPLFVFQETKAASPCLSAQAKKTLQDYASVLPESELKRVLMHLSV